MSRRRSKRPGRGQGGRAIPGIPENFPARMLDRPPAVRPESEAARVLDLLDNLKPGGRER